MNIGAIERVVASYVQQSESKLVVNGQSLIRTALNNARRQAERFHDWCCQEVTVYGTAIDGEGNWKTGVFDVETEEAVRLKQPLMCYLENNGVLVPVDHQGKKVGVSQAKDYLHRRTGAAWCRYKGDGSSSVGLDSNIMSLPGSFRFFMFGNGKFKIEPTIKGPQKFVIDGYRWLDDYTDDEDEDFFTEHGADYLQWAAIVETNYLTQTFIPQQEGNLAPPEKARDAALANLIAYDNFIVESGATLE